MFNFEYCIFGLKKLFVSIKKIKAISLKFSDLNTNQLQHANIKKIFVD